MTDTNTAALDALEILHTFAIANCSGGVADMTKQMQIVASALSGQWKPIETELARILAPEIIQKIRAKQASKPTGSALPIPIPVPALSGVTVAWGGSGDYEPTQEMIEAGLWTNHRHNSEKNMVESFKAMMAQAEMEGLISLRAALEGGPSDILKEG